MTTHYLSIYNRETTTLNYSGFKDPTASLLKVEGELSPAVVAAAKFIVTDGVLVKINEGGRYPKCGVGETLTDEQIHHLQFNYEKTTTQYLNTSDKVEAILA